VILIVDDSRLMRSLLEATLRGAGFATTTLASAAALHAFLAAQVLAGELSQLDALLIDLTMPDEDGLEAIIKLRDQSLLDDLPIVVVTSRSEREDLEAAFAAGGNDFITKPPQSFELIARVSNAVRLKRAVEARRAREAELEALTEELAQANARLKALAVLDGLTGIANRRAFDEKITAAWQEHLALAQPLALMLLDVDYFKRYNDSLGHQQGDECLKIVAKALDASIWSPHLAARYGGEEFVVVLDRHDQSSAAAQAEKVRQAIADLVLPHPNGVRPYVTVSLGVVSMVPNAENTPKQLIEAADQALYAAKQAGRDRVILGGTG
jgi:diguanylate cyclase (GGDEF)-like protein